MKWLFIISSFFFSGLALGQSSPKLYAYSQDFTPGMIPGRQSENGMATNLARTRTTYFIYFSQSSKEKVDFDKIRIGKQWYTIAQVDTVKSPVYTDEPQRKLLVPLTKNQVLQLRIGDTCTASPGNFNTKISSATVVLLYKWKAKKYKVISSAIKKLPAVHAL